MSRISSPARARATDEGVRSNLPRTPNEDACGRNRASKQNASGPATSADGALAQRGDLNRLNRLGRKVFQVDGFDRIVTVPLEW